MVNTMLGFPDEYKHLVTPTHPDLDDMDFNSVVQLVQQGHKMKKIYWEQEFVDLPFATYDIRK